MNLLDGQLTDAKQSKIVLDTLGERVLATLERGRLDPDIVIEACHRLIETMDDEAYLSKMISLGIQRLTGESYLKQAKIMFSRDYLQERLKTELGENYNEEYIYTPFSGDSMVGERIMPLGVLLHIAAGNADALPAFSVLEGLLTGNINILKLPEVDAGISIDLLMELIKIEPKLTEYIYVFDYSSKDEKSISKLIKFADAVVVWGGDAAISAIRLLVGPNIRLIEWGHKISFAYVTEGGIDDEAMRGLARNICHTDQLLCSSCQGVFLDSDDMTDVYRFCERFLPILDDTAKSLSSHETIGVVSQVTLKLYNEELESHYYGSRIYRGEKSSIIAYCDRDLDISIQFRNCWVKPLPRAGLLQALLPYKNHLQTVALLCADHERPALTRLLAKTGIVRVTDGDKMSSTYCGAAHDGEYPLRRYTKIFSTE